ncbi:BnaC06g01330D [Brassica napus]|uniref:BnaC06g01330D protein n=1 Tax=Brassica napus TaxID=3708 RepID=A0A078G8D0_BRANA|nr:BnaC06g01330D [Brassica napus]
MLQFICDAEHGIPSSCPCGGRTVDEVSINPTDRDFLPGRRYFTCNAYKVIYIFSILRRGSLLKAEGGRNGCRDCSA